MMKTKFLLLLSLLLSSVTITYGQTAKEAVNFPTPNASSLGLFGEIPANHFTGIPNINIPLHTVSSGDLKVPINLSYHVGNVKQDRHPGWVGLGWNLSAGGAITRVVNDVPDEKKCIVACQDWFEFSNGYNVDDHYRYLEQDNWDSTTSLDGYVAAKVLYADETQADEFHFNFLGYSGSFYLNHEGEWEVKSEHNLTVVFDENTGYATKEDI